MWTLSGVGWATCTVADDNAPISVEASYITDAPGDLLRAVARLTLGDTKQRVDFNMEPTQIRWIIRAFDNVAELHGEAGYLKRWRYPRQELETLRRAWRSAKRGELRGGRGTPGGRPLR